VAITTGSGFRTLLPDQSPKLYTFRIEILHVGKHGGRQAGDMHVGLVHMGVNGFPIKVIFYSSYNCCNKKASLYCIALHQQPEVNKT